MQIFIGWSGPRSRRVAEATKDWLRNVIHLAEPWVSDDTPLGANWPAVIEAKLHEAQFGILCITPENTDAPWLAFEAGVLSSRLGAARVVPLLLDMSPNDLDGPLKVSQGATISREKMALLARTINDLLKHKLAPDVLTRSLSANWRTFSESVDIARNILLESNSIRGVLKTLRKHGLPEPSEDRALNFAGGFESHSLYEALFPLARKRLYIFGRKNRKVFDKEHEEFLRGLPTRIAKGFDFRCLFLNPAAPKSVVKDAHADGDFAEQLERCVAAAKKQLHKYNLPYGRLCRLYATNRPHAMVAVDDLVLFAPQGVDPEGKTKAFTKCPFRLLDKNDSFAAGLLAHFDATWSKAKPMK